EAFASPRVLPALAARARRALARAATAQADPHVRRAAVVGLGLLGPASERALRAVIEGEASYLVKSNALKALAHVRSPRLLETCRAAMEDRGWRDLVPMAALDALAIAKPPEAFDLA